MLAELTRWSKRSSNWVAQSSERRISIFRIPPTSSALLETAWSNIVYDENGKICISGGSDCLQSFIWCGHLFGSRAILACFAWAVPVKCMEYYCAIIRALKRLDVEMFFLEGERHFADCFRLVYFSVHCVLLFAGTPIAWPMQWKEANRMPKPGEFKPRTLLKGKHFYYHFLLNTWHGILKLGNLLLFLTVIVPKPDMKQLKTSSDNHCIKNTTFILQTASESKTLHHCCNWLCDLRLSFCWKNVDTSCFLHRSKVWVSYGGFHLHNDPLFKYALPCKKPWFYSPVILLFGTFEIHHEARTKWE